MLFLFFLYTQMPYGCPQSSHICARYSLQLINTIIRCPRPAYIITLMQLILVHYTKPCRHSLYIYIAKITDSQSNAFLPHPQHILITYIVGFMTIRRNGVDYIRIYSFIHKNVKLWNARTYRMRKSINPYGNSQNPYFIEIIAK